MTEPTIKALLHAVDDGDCRAILDAIEEEAKSVKELSGECDIPLSTAYRKIDRLQEAGLVEEGVRLSGSGNHTHVYEQRFDGALIRLVDGDFEVELVGSERTPRRVREVGVSV